MLALVALLAAVVVPPPYADHHMHVLSPAAAERNSVKPLPAIELPADVAHFMRERTKRWNDKAGLAELFTVDAMVLDSEDAAWMRGREEAAAYLSTRFAGAYEFVPVLWLPQQSTVTGYYQRGQRPITHVQLTLAKHDGAWRIAVETPVLKGLWTRETLTADQLVAQLDEAGIQKGVVLSVAFWFRGEYEKVKAENDWMASQVARYPDRLVGFCGVDPTRDYAPEEIARCAAKPQVVGVKIQLGNSRVDLHNPEHVEKLKRVFRAANAHKMAIVAHLWNGPDYGRDDAEIFLRDVFPAAPDVTVQIAHFAGGGPGYTDEALAVFADAIAKNDPRTKNVYFDVATVATEQPVEELKRFAMRIRQVGPQRVLYGTDSSPPNPPARVGWANFRISVPLTDEEFRTIATNVVPYLRR